MQKTKWLWSKIIPKTEIGEAFVINNAKRMLLDIYHSIKPNLLQNYLNKFCYKFNRIYFDENLFDRLVNCFCFL